MKPSLAAKWVGWLALLALPAIAAAPPNASGGDARTARRAGVPVERADQARVIVQYRSDGTLVRESALAAAASGREPRVQHAARLSQRLGLPLADGSEVMPRTQVLHAKGLSSSELVARLRADPDVEMAWIDERVRAAVAPNDPRYPGNQTTITPAVGQWYLRAPDTTAASAINAEGAWDVTQGSPAIVVAVLDTGVRPDHPDLAGKLLPGYDFVSEDSPGIFATANDGNGRDADPSDPGDWITAGENASGTFQGCGVSDSSWHGTQTTGLVGAATNNGVGMASVGRNVRVLPVRVLGKCGGFLSDVVAGMYWAAGISAPPGVPANANPAKVVNLSLGSAGACAGSPYDAAVRDLTAAGVVVVAAAGNDAGHAVGRPANCPGAIGVGGLRHMGTKVGFSDVGPEISISAPGGNCVNLSGECLFPLLSTTNAGLTTPAGNTYTDGGNNATLGTSFSSPLAAGTAALMLSRNSSLNPAQVRVGLMGTARAFPATGGSPGTPMCVAPTGADQLECYCTTSTCGAGMLDARGAVSAVAGLKAWTSPSSVQVQAGSSTVVSGADSWALPPAQITTRAWSVASGTGVTLAPSADGKTVTVTGTAAGTAVVRLTITDGASTPSTADTTVTVVAAPSSGGGGGGALSFVWLLALAVAAMRLKALPSAAADNRRSTRETE